MTTENPLAKPLTFSEVIQRKTSQIPEEVIVAINEELISKFNVELGYARIYQRDIIERILRLNPKITRGDIYSRNYLNFKSYFIEAGWNVSEIGNVNDGQDWNFSWRH